MDPLSILHISDLHRDPNNEVSNKALLLSLELDRDRYRNETPKIPDPNLIIASGDIIHGVRHDATDAEAELQRQYDQADRFLAELADRFIDGDRERVIIIPGNHDVSFIANPAKGEPVGERGLPNPGYRPRRRTARRQDKKPRRDGGGR
jgi:3',5'-cyclic AMP phosphodiesterase CpdA